MKIAQVVCVFPPYRGGIGTMAQNHAISLAKAGHEVDVLTPHYKKDLADRERDPAGFYINRLRPDIAVGNAGVCTRIAPMLNDYDVVHLHYPFFGTAELIWLLSRRKKAEFKLVVTYHMDVVGGIFLRPFFAFHTKFIMPRIISAADRIIVTSNDYAAHSNISKLFYRLANRFSDIPPEIDVNHFTPREDVGEIADRHGIDPEKDRVLLFVGGLDKAHYFKGIDFLIDAFRVLSESGDQGRLKLLVVGDGDMRGTYERKARAAGLSDHIIFAGSVSYEDLPRYYSLADLLVLPSVDQSEAFGIVLLEAMACGTPVVASRLPGVRTAVKEGVDGFLFQIGHEGELAAVINDALADPEKLREMGRAGREKVVREHSPEVIRDRLLKIYDKLCKPRLDKNSQYKASVEEQSKPY